MQLSYLIGFSCELSWILESPNTLPVASHILCAGELLVFIACTALVYGLATGTHLGAVIWASVLIVFMVPELTLVIYTVTHHWGLQSNHGQTELIGYLIRLLFDSVALLCVIPLILRWREEQRVLSQLEMLTSRSHLSAAHSPRLTQSTRSSIRSVVSNASNGRQHKKLNGTKNNAYVNDELDNCSVKSGIYDSQSEFDASLFSPTALYDQHNAMYGKRAQSLMDLRAVNPPEHLLRKPSDSNFIAAMKQYWLANTLKQDGLDDSNLLFDKKFNYYYKQNNNKNKEPLENFPPQRKSQSLVDLNNASKNEVYKNNLFRYEMKPNNMYLGVPPNVYNMPMGYPIYPMPGFYMPHMRSVADNGQGSYYYTSSNNVCYIPPDVLGSNRNSRLSLGSDDFTKYRDVAL
ncbi:uncharacterized protein LOC113370871 [Ctenocephalides felis]|uniref:uncharacterized protein LOC113370871 n=1 Tax=Ctenocephalides felis TaxID=7515 RepID=UPI000E6E507B|nr:uncharacterized protein LOC113370871 [Ctenocephalides felis]